VRTDLRVPYRDTAADQLVWRLGEPCRPALATLELVLPGGQVELRLLGSSHQVIFTAGSTVISEVVACDPSDGHAGVGADRDTSRPGAGSDPAAQPVAVPSVAERALDGWDYRFGAATRRLAPDPFRYRVDRLVGRLADHPAAIVGSFPGSPHAVTALLAEVSGTGAGIRWRTWHAYPQDGRLVATSTTLRPRRERAR
jgi:hypothetical protein